MLKNCFLFLGACLDKRQQGIGLPQEAHLQNFMGNHLQNFVGGFWIKGGFWEITSKITVVKIISDALKKIWRGKKILKKKEEK